MKGRHEPALPDKSEEHKDRLVGREAEWFEWTGGSTPFFWRWSEYSKPSERDGHPPWFKTDPPEYFRPQRGQPNEEVRAKVWEKLANVWEKGDISAGTMKSLTSYFAAAKGESDIQIM